MTEAAAENSMTVKRFTFRCVNSFSRLFYLGFWQRCVNSLLRGRVRVFFDHVARILLDVDELRSSESENESKRPRETGPPLLPPTAGAVLYGTPPFFSWARVQFRQRVFSGTYVCPFPPPTLCCLELLGLIALFRWWGKLGRGRCFAVLKP